jgi:hypothetical protein
MKNKNTGYIILIILAILSLIGMLIISPIEQDKSYHNFSDIRIFFGIPNFWNVISNLPFLIVGFLGLYNLNTIARKKTQYLLFFLGVVLIAFGSVYYHLDPNDYTLIWDRLPMTIAFMALFSIVISEFINSGKGRSMLFSLLIVGLLAVLYWVIFNDLSFYAFVQFYPMLAIPVILIFFKSDYTLTIGYWVLLLAYIISKLLEHFDDEVYSFLKLISGHSLKHLVASIGIFVLFYTFIKRKQISYDSHE